MTKSKLRILEKMFVLEIESALSESRMPLCYQSKAKVMDELCDEGLIEAVEFKIGRDALAVTVRGYVLTHAGRIAYCASC